MAIRDGFIKLRQHGSNKELIISVTQQSCEVIVDPDIPDPTDPDVQYTILDVTGKVEGSTYALIGSWNRPNPSLQKNELVAIDLNNGSRTVLIPVTCNVDNPVRMEYAFGGELIEIHVYDESLNVWRHVDNFVTDDRLINLVDLHYTPGSPI